MKPKQIEQLYKAAKEGNLDFFVEIYSKNRVDAESQCHHVFMKRIRRNSTGHYEYYLQDHTTEIKCDSTIMKTAAVNGHISIVQFLIDNGFTNKDHARDILPNIAHSGYLNIIKLIIDKIEPIVPVALITRSACVEGHCDIIRYMIDNYELFNLCYYSQCIKNPDCHCGISYRYSLLRLACKYNKNDIVDMLLDKDHPVSYKEIIAVIKDNQIDILRKIFFNRPAIITEEEEQLWIWCFLEQSKDCLEFLLANVSICGNYFSRYMSEHIHTFVWKSFQKIKEYGEMEVIKEILQVITKYNINIMNVVNPKTGKTVYDFIKTNQGARRRVREFIEEEKLNDEYPEFF